ncbi:MAG: hypothetical protein ASARMPREDX12_003887 [Alectoria sarmentosa]|nr:MAG: hypothetical protein ASARMPREDX12_003887 [Alectoria sarmentosa]
MSSTNSPSNAGLPPTLYDETHRGIWHMKPHVNSFGNAPSLIAHLEHYDPTTDGSFAVCIAAGSGNFISKELYQSIPQEHRPGLDTRSHQVGLWFSEDQTALGATFIPIILKNAKTEKPFRIVLHAYVLPTMLGGTFISHPTWIGVQRFVRRVREYRCDFGDGKIVKVKGLRLEKSQVEGMANPTRYSTQRRRLCPTTLSNCLRL